MSEVLKEHSEPMDIASPQPSKPSASSSSPKFKDFSLSGSPDTVLLPLVTDEDISSVFASKKSQEKVDEDEFEMVPNEESMNPFVSAAIAHTKMSLTENSAPTFSTSGDSRLDFYFGVLEDTREQIVEKLLTQSWIQDQLDTLKIIANTRDIRRGKGIRPQYQQCLFWLYQNHPKTLYENLEELVSFGYWKDILHLITIALFDGYIPPYFKKDANPKGAKRPNPKPTKSQIKRSRRNRTRKNKKNNVNEAKLPRREVVVRVGKHLRFTESQIKNAKKIRVEYDAEKRHYNQKIADHYKKGKKVAELAKNEMTEYRLKFAREKLKTDPKYRVFHAKIAEIFAKQLVTDLTLLKESQTTGVKPKTDISLAAKWAPSLEAHFDRYTLMGSAIGLQIAKLTNSNILTSNKSNPVATYLARKLYSQTYLRPLRQYHHIPEQFMSANKWDKVNYARVPAKCMTKNKSHFMKHDKERLESYVNAKDTKIAGASLKPVEIIYEAMDPNKMNGTGAAILEKQWESLVESIKKNASDGGLFKGAVSICDVSGSMEGVPMKAAIGLTLITMQCTSPPWNSICITFSEIPTLFHLKEELTLKEKLNAMKQMLWGSNTDIHKVFELILELGIKNKLKDEDMPKLLFIFTDMEFDQACPGTDKTNFEAAKDLFQSNGYSLPTIVFWNLRDSAAISYRVGVGIKNSTPVQKNEVGAVLLSGFSGQMLSYLMKSSDPKELEKLTPIKFMEDVINDDRYGKLKVFD